MPKKILVTDDAMFIRLTLKNILTNHGFNDIIEASNGEEAVQQYAVHQPDLVLMDITMPVMDGISAVRAIKIQYPTARIIMCSAMGQKEMILQAIQAGAKDFILKPFQPDRVIESVRKLIG